jgi:dipeptidyl aminopeptidase/acylaminoacyl peptidase
VPRTAYRAAALTGDGRPVYVGADRDTEFTAAYEIDLATGTFRPLGPTISWNLEGLALSHDERSLALVFNQDGRSRLYLVDTRSRRWRAVPDIPDGVIRDLRAAADADRFGFTVDTAISPSGAWTLDARTLQATRWTAGEPGALAGRRLVEPILVRHPTFDGRHIPALYYRPAGRGRYPVLIDIHGGPEGQSRPVYDGLVQYLASSAGWAVLQPNVRGSSGYGRTYLGLDNGRRREGAVKDIGALLDWVDHQPELDRDRVAVMGASYGGYMVLASLVHHGDRLAGGIELAGSSSFLSLLESVPDELRDIRRREVGDERDPAMRAFLHHASPLTHADRIRDPMFVAQGLNDRRVPPRESDQIVRAVRRNHVPVWYLTAADEGHGFARNQNRDLYLALTVLFLETHVR